MISGFRCRYNIDDKCIGSRCDECKNNPIYKQGRADAIDDALNYCNQNNDDKEECWSCCLSIWENGRFNGCYLEQLKEQK